MDELNELRVTVSVMRFDELGKMVSEARQHAYVCAWEPVPAFISAKLAAALLGHVDDEIKHIKEEENA